MTVDVNEVETSILSVLESIFKSPVYHVGKYHFHAAYFAGTDKGLFYFSDSPNHYWEIRLKNPKHDSLVHKKHRLH